MALLLCVALAPAAALTNPYAFLQNIVLFPLGLTKHQTPAAGPLPRAPAGHEPGMAGRWAAVGLLLVAGLDLRGLADHPIRPPADRPPPPGESRWASR